MSSVVAMESGAMRPCEKASAASRSEAFLCRPATESSRKGKKIAEVIRMTLAKALASVRSMAPRRLVSSVAPQRRQRSRPPWGTGATACSMSQVGQAMRSGEAATGMGMR